MEERRMLGRWSKEKTQVFALSRKIPFSLPSFKSSLAKMPAFLSLCFLVLPGSGRAGCCLTLGAIRREDVLP